MERTAAGSARVERILVGRRYRCGCRVRGRRPVYPTAGARLLGHSGRRIAPCVYPHSLIGRHWIFCGDAGPYARGGRSYQRRPTHEVWPEGVGRIGVWRGGR